MRFSKIKSASTGNGVMRHIRRQLDIKTLSHPERKNINILTEPIKEKYQNKTFNEILKGKLNGNKPRSNSVLALEFVFAYTPGCVPDENLKAFVIFGKHISTSSFFFLLVLNMKDEVEKIEKITATIFNSSCFYVRLFNYQPIV